MRIYQGTNNGSYHVHVVEAVDADEAPVPRELPEQPDLFKTPPPPFRWGDDTPGVTHLAAALLYDLSNGDRRVVREGLPFLRRFLAHLPDDGFEISETIFRALLHASIAAPSPPAGTDPAK